MARQQEQLSRLVIDEMQAGVLVVDRRGRVRAANPAAGKLLGEAQPLSLRGRAAWQPWWRRSNAPCRRRLAGERR